MRSPICANIQKSCCTLKDNKNIYDSWISSKEKDFIKERFEFQRSIYSKLFQNLLKVRERAHHMVE